MKKSVLIAVVIAVIAFLWVLSGVIGSGGQDGGDSNAEPAQTSLKKDEIPEVRVRDLVAQPMEDNIEVTGRTRASRKVYLKSETDGQVASVQVEKGAAVKKGEILARLKLEDRSAVVLEAEQLLNQRQIQFNAARELSEKGFNSRVRLAEAEAQLETAKAQLAKARVELSNINIKAPFEAIVNGQMVEVGDYVSKGTDMFDVVDLDPIEIAGFLTEKQVELVSEGVFAEAEFLTDDKINGEITFIAPAANSETRTFEIEMTVDNPDYAIREGLTAKIKIPVKEAQAYKISPSILSLADDGTVGVKIVNADDIVEFMPIKLLKDTPDYLWVGGLPEAVRIITVGQEFVIVGQKVKPIPAEGNDLL